MAEFTIMLAPTLELAQTIAQNAAATVEAEYGDICVEGKDITLAHHGPRSGNPAPCNTEVEPISGGMILVSHLDLDTIGGIMAIKGTKPEDPEFWRAAEYVDLHGPHHIHRFPKEIQDKFNAFYAAEFALRDKEGRINGREIKDITKDAEKREEAVKAICIEQHPEHERYISRGKQWAKERADAAEKQAVADTQNVRVFMTNGVSTAAAYYSEKDKEIKPATVTYNAKFGTITIALEDGGKSGVSAMRIAREIWGEGAGGKDGIAGSPHGMEMTENDLVRAVSEVEKAVNPGPKQAIENRLSVLKKALEEKPLMLRFIEPNRPGRKIQIETVKKNPSMMKYIKDPAVQAEIAAVIEGTLRSERSELDTENEAHSGNREQMFPDGLLDEMDKKGLASLDSDMCVLVSDEKKSAVRETDNGDFEFVDRKLEKQMLEISPVGYDENERVYRIFNTFVVEPSKEGKDTVNVYEAEMRTNEEDARRRAEEETRRMEAESRERAEEERKKAIEKSRIVLRQIRAGIAIGMALDLIEDRCKSVKTMKEVDKRIAMRSAVRKKIESFTRGERGVKKKEERGIARSKVI